MSSSSLDLKLSKSEKVVYAALMAHQQTINEIVKNTKLNKKDVTDALRSLSERKMVEQLRFDIPLYVAKSLLPSLYARTQTAMTKTAAKIDENKEYVLSNKTALEQQLVSLKDSIGALSSLLSKLLAKGEELYSTKAIDISQKSVKELAANLDVDTKSAQEKLSKNKKELSDTLAASFSSLDAKIAEIITAFQKQVDEGQEELKTLSTTYKDEITAVNSKLTEETKTLETNVQTNLKDVEEQFAKVLHQTITKAIDSGEDVKSSLNTNLKDAQKNFGTYFLAITKEVDATQQDIFGIVNRLIESTIKLFLKNLDDNQTRIFDVIDKNTKMVEDQITVSGNEFISKMTLSVGEVSGQLKTYQTGVKKNLTGVPTILKGLENEIDKLYESYTESLIAKTSENHQQIRAKVDGAVGDFIALEKEEHEKVTKETGRFISEFEKYGSQMISTYGQNIKSVISQTEATKKSLKDTHESLDQQITKATTDMVAEIDTQVTPLKNSLQLFVEKKNPELASKLKESTETIDALVKEQRESNKGLLDQNLSSIVKIKENTVIAKSEFIENLKKRLNVLNTAMTVAFDRIDTDFTEHSTTIISSVENSLKTNNQSLQKDWSDIKKKLNDEQKKNDDTLKKKINKQNADIKNSLTALSTDITTEIDKTAQTIAEALEGLKDTISSNIGVSTTSLDTNFASIQSELSEYLKGFATNITTTYDGYFANIEDTNNTIIEEVTECLEGEKTTISSLHTTQKDDIQNQSDKTVSDAIKISGVIDTSLTDATNQLQTAITDIVSSLNSSSTKVTAAAITAVSMTKDVNKALLKDITEQQSAVGNLSVNLSEKITEFKDKNTQTITTDFDNLINLFDEDIEELSASIETESAHFTDIINECGAISKSSTELFNTSIKDYQKTVDEKLKALDAEFTELQTHNSQEVTDIKTATKEQISTTSSKLVENYTKKGDEIQTIIEKTMQSLTEIDSELEYKLTQSLGAFSNTFKKDMFHKEIEQTLKVATNDFDQSAKKTKFEGESRALALSSTFKKLEENSKKNIDEIFLKEIDKTSTKVKNASDDLIEHEKQAKQELRKTAEELVGKMYVFVTSISSGFKTMIDKHNELNATSNSQFSDSFKKLAKKTTAQGKEEQKLLLDMLHQIQATNDTSYNTLTSDLQAAVTISIKTFEALIEKYKSVMAEVSKEVGETQKKELTASQQTFNSLNAKINETITQNYDKLHNVILPSMADEVKNNLNETLMFVQDIDKDYQAFSDKLLKDIDTYVISTVEDVTEALNSLLSSVTSLLVVYTSDLSKLPEKMFEIPTSLRVRIITSSNTPRDQINKIYRRTTNFSVYEIEKPIQNNTYCFIADNNILQFTESDQGLWGIFTKQKPALKFYSEDFVNQTFKLAKLVSRTTSS